MSAAVSMAIVITYMLVVLGIGIFAYRVGQRTAEDFYLASRTFGTVVLLFTMFATLLSAFTFFGGPDASYVHGPEWILVMGLMDGLIFAVLWYIIGYKQWLLGQRHGYVTLGEMLGDRFGSTLVRATVALVSLFWLFPYVMLQQIGAGGALSALTEGVVPFWVGASLITVFMIVYVVLAGMRGIAWTDTLQGAFMLVVIWAALLWVLTSAGGIAEINTGIEATQPEFLGLGSSFYTPQQMLTLAVSIAFGVAMFPQVNQRFFTAASDRILKRSLILWPVLVLLLFLPAFLLGTWAVGLGIEADIGEGDHVLPIVLEAITPTWFAALVIAGAIAAMMSSSDSMLLSGASYFTRDVYRPLIDDGLTTRREDTIARIGVVVFAVAALAASLWTEAGGHGAGSIGVILIDIGELAFGGFAQLAPVVLVTLYWRRVTTAAVLAGILGPQLVYITFSFIDPVSLGPVVLFAGSYAGWGISLYCMVLGLVLTITVSLLTAPASAEEPGLFFEGLRAE